MSSLFPRPRLYRNMNHETYRPEDTQFDEGEMAVEDGTVTTPTNGNTRGEEKEWSVDEKKQNKSSDKKKGRGRKKSSGPPNQPSSDAEAEPDSQSRKGKSKSKSNKGSRTNSDDESDSVDHAAESSTANNLTGAAPGLSLPGAETASDSIFSHLLLESILSQKSVSDFIGGLPDKRGALLVRFPTTILGKSWKKRYFTLHGDCLYFHEDQSVIHPSLGGESMSSSVAGTGKAGHGVPYEKCKKIEIEKFWIIQQDHSAATDAGASSQFGVSRSAAAAAPQLNAAGEKLYGQGQPIPSTPTAHVDPDASGWEGGTPRHVQSGVNSRYASPRGASGGESHFRRGSQNLDEGPTVRGRRRSSVVNEKGSTVILLIPKDKKEDALELTGLNEGKMADLPILNEWVEQINARIALLNFLHNPLNSNCMNRGGREVLAFLTDASQRQLRICNKFTDLEPVLTHFRESLTHRPGLRVEFSNCAFTDGALAALAEIVASAPGMDVEGIDLTRNLLTENGMGALHRALKANPRVKSLTLDQNQIGDRGVEMLVYGQSTDARDGTHSTASSAASTPTSSRRNSDASSVDDTSFWSPDTQLQSLSLAGNQLSDRSVHTLTRSILRFTQSDAERRNVGLHFTRLDLSSNQLTDEGVQTLAGFLLKNPRVDQLNLSHNFITDQGCVYLKEVFAHPSCGVSKVELQGNQISSAGAIAILEGIEANPRQRKVDVNLSDNTGMDGAVLTKLLSIKAATRPDAAAEANKDPWGVRITSLAFTVYDQQHDEVQPEPSPRLQLSSPGADVATISTAQQNVLSLFSPSPTTHTAPLPQYPVTSPAATSQQQAPSAAKVAPASSSNTASASSSVSNTPTSSKKHKAQSRKDRKRASINDPLAPKIAIAAQPLKGGQSAKLAIEPLHPPPPHEEVQMSPVEGAAGGPDSKSAASVVGGATPCSSCSTVSAPLSTPNPIQPPVAPSEKEEEEEVPQALLPAQKGETKPRGLVSMM